MQRNRWLLVLLFLFVLIQVFGFVYYHSEDEICPECDGSGVSRRGYTCSECSGTGSVWRCSAPTAVALYILFFTSFFFGFFYLSYISALFQVEINPWVTKVDRMKGPCFNPMYMAWLFSNDRRGWGAQTTIWGAIVAVTLGTILFNGLPLEKVSSENSLLGFIVGCSFLALLALSWYKCYWKPRTSERPVILHSSVEAEWKDKKL
jgi:hypothetical protein